MTNPLPPERLAAIRALGDDEHRTCDTLDQAVDDLLTERDRLAAENEKLLAALHRKS